MLLASDLSGFIGGWGGGWGGGGGGAVLQRAYAKPPSPASNHVPSYTLTSVSAGKAHAQW